MEHGKNACQTSVGNGIKIGDSTPHASGNAAHQAGSFSTIFPPAMTFDEQVSKMEGRGLVVEDRHFAIHCLSEANYYRLRGYWLVFEKDGRFLDGTCFEDIWEIYELDRELRLWMWKAIAPIEVKLRTQFAYQAANFIGPGAHLDAGAFQSSGRAGQALAGYRRERDRAYKRKVPCVVHNMDKYGELPIWAAVEVMTFGTLSKLYGSLGFRGEGASEGKRAAAAIADSFGISHHYMKSWIHHLVTVRNIVAHHDRLYNRVMSIRPLMLNRDNVWSSSKQFPTLLVVKRMYEKSWPQEWDELVEDLAACFSTHPKVPLAPMGFPANWKKLLMKGETR